VCDARTDGERIPRVASTLTGNNAATQLVNTSSPIVLSAVPEIQGYAARGVKAHTHTHTGALMALANSSFWPTNRVAVVHTVPTANVAAININIQSASGTAGSVRRTFATDGNRLPSPWCLTRPAVWAHPACSCRLCFVGLASVRVWAPWRPAMSALRHPSERPEPLRGTIAAALVETGPCRNFG
jgi:hypothetical protein